MTGEDIETSLRALGIGWDPVTRGYILEGSPSATCNAQSCASYARIGNDAGSTADDVALAILAAEFEGNPLPRSVILQAAEDARS